MEHKRIIISPTKVTMGNLTGNILTKKDDLTFLQRICNIDTSQYDFIYKLNDNWAGGYFLRSGDNYRIIMCGSGVPIVSDRSGTLKRRN